MNTLAVDQHKTSHRQTFNIAILYEAPSDGIHAKQFGDRLAGEAATGRIINRGVWNFRVLGISSIRNIAASAAANADVVILSMSGKKPLSPEMEEWLEMWTWLIDRGHPAVFALFAGPGAERAHIHADLQRTTSRKGLEFFSEMLPVKRAQRHAL